MQQISMRPFKHLQDRAKVISRSHTKVFFTLKSNLISTKKKCWSLKINSFRNNALPFSARDVVVVAVVAAAASDFDNAKI